jgi:hypothetical protein
LTGERASLLIPVHWRAFAVVGFLTIGFSAQPAAPVLLNDPVQGQKLAAELRAMTPAEGATFKGTLHISAPRSETRDVPIQLSVVVGNKAWSSSYHARPTKAPTEDFTISRGIGGSTNYYQWQHGEALEKPTGNFATNSFAGSDFALLDLGLEFFNWPTQTLVFNEMRKSRGCHVLESRPASPTIYSRVLSWIDEETNGLLMAEAYDARGKILKEFEINSFKKIGDRYQVSEMEIRNRQTKTRTRLEFEFPEK